MNLNEQTSAILRVSGGSSLAGGPCEIEVDEYVPLRLRTYKAPLGVGYVRLGNYSTTLIELAVEPRVQVLRGVTITSIDALSPWPQFSVTESLDELPVLSTHFEGGEIMSLKNDFEVSARWGEIVVFWGGLDPCKAYTFGGVRFLAHEGILLGIWFTGLTGEQTSLFLSHARHAGVQPEELSNNGEHGEAGDNRRTPVE